MPGHPDPRTNLALTLERVGQEDRALAEYDADLEVYAGYMPALQGRTALALRRGAEREELAEALREIVAARHRRGVAEVGGEDDGSPALRSGLGGLLKHYYRGAA